MRALLTCLALLLAAPAQAAWYSDTRNKMGTRIQLRLWHEDEEAASRLLAAGMDEVDRIEALMSTYRETSEISRVNREAADKPVQVSEELFGLIERSLALSAQTGGAFDITYDSIGHLYDYRGLQRPDQATIDAHLDAIDYRMVKLDVPRRTIRFGAHGVRINLGGIAKGYAVDSVIELFRDAGVEHALATAGGDSRLLGDRRGQPWMVGIRDPDDEAGLVTRMALIDEAISTSGDYERYFDEDGVRYHHILDPDTGDSARLLRSATVIGPDATMTDGLSTSLFVMGPDDGMALIDSLPDYEAVIVLPDHSVRFSKGLAPPPSRSRLPRFPAPGVRADNSRRAARLAF